VTAADYRSSSPPPAACPDTNIAKGGEGCGGDECNCGGRNEGVGDVGSKELLSETAAKVINRTQFSLQ
jgi:hypothetical protein